MNSDLLRDIIDAVADPIFVKDENHRWILLNEAACRYIGHSREELIGKSDFDIFPEEEALVFWAKDDEVFRSGKTMENEERFTGAGGDTRIISTKKSVFVTESGEKILVGVIRDLTRLKRTEQELREAHDLAQEASVAKSRFLANASHELRTPLNGIVGIAELLQDRPWDDEVQELLDVLKDSAGNLLALVNDLLDFSAVDSGRVSLTRALFSPASLMRSLSTFFEHQARKKGLTLHTTIADDLPEFTMGDENRLRQVLVNLASNAVKFTPSGGRIEMSCRAGPDHRTLEFAIQDNGIGIPRDKLDLIFFPFFKARETDQGTGLGLAICRQLMELMDGTIELEMANPGCTALVTLPFSPEEASPQKASPDRSEIRTFPGLRVLVVEDDPVSQRVATLTLKRLECAVTVAADGVAALAELEGTPFDLILMDCRMPNLDGYETARRIRKKEDVGSRVPIIALTAHAFEEDREKCLAAGMDYWLTKPLRRELLAKAILQVQAHSR
ncbi:MAG: response regulator [Vulcanimicrobiota bacterium]